MSEHDVVEVEEPIYVGKFVAHLIRIDNKALRMTSCGIHIPAGEELDERAAWPHLAVCGRCVKGRKAQLRRRGERAAREAAQAETPSWL